MFNLQYVLGEGEISVSEWDNLQAIIFFNIYKAIQGSFLNQGTFILNQIVQNNKAS